MTRTDAIDKVRKLLALCNGTGYEGEAESSRTAAQRLIDKYQLTTREIEGVPQSVSLKVEVSFHTHFDDLSKHWETLVGGESSFTDRPLKRPNRTRPAPEAEEP